MELLLICGGPSRERDISLNSVRSVFDHFRSMSGINLKVVFIDEKMKKYVIDERFLYSNTAYDFEFMLSSNEEICESDYEKMLHSSDMVFPVMHGQYGEDGGIQLFLEELGVPFIASSSRACKMMYDKKNADDIILKANKLTTIPKLFLRLEDDIQNKIFLFMSENKIYDAVIKPTKGGSSIGVNIVHGVESAIRQANESLNTYDEIVIEAMCHGKEFTIIVLEANNQVSALMPTEIELLDKDGCPVVGEIFDKRKKYLSTTETHYYCPARFDRKKIGEIMETAENLFKIVGAHDFLRIDGWLLDDGSVYFSDFNPISGMEQNSFIFQQSAAIGLRHKDLLALILSNACKRYGIEYDLHSEDISSKQRLHILLGGITSERQVSLMSGTNAWLKLLNSKKYYPVPYILFRENEEFTVYEVPYAAALKHTTEEIYDYINYRSESYIKYANELKDKIVKKLCIQDFINVSDVISKRMSLSEFIKFTKSQNADVFIGLHGGFGENGGLQSMLENAGIHFNGAGSQASELCMNKYMTGEKIKEAAISGVRTCKKILIKQDEIFQLLNDTNKKWDDICAFFNANRVVVKPNGDGCSTGIVILTSSDELRRYVELILEKNSFVPENAFENQPEKIQLPSKIVDIIFEEYIATPKLIVTDRSVIADGYGDWIEMTVGVICKGKYHSFNPSITVADNAVLSLEEKFQGGTGINITPPPVNIISANLCKKIKSSMEKVAEVFKIKDYCRIDIFANTKTEEIVVIEVNTLPGLSPSTVLFQQGAKESPPLYPMELLEAIISK